PTAAYGCLVAASEAPSCADFRGRVTPAMLRDASNRYNTYRHPGLPPGPIANPGESAIAAVFSPARSDYRFFVRNAAGGHSFSRTFEEHSRGVRALQGGPSTTP
ncbi:MAG TPA: endolytic transglycosylase MltG, partial [Polyangiaceae bacterium]|nr:endolytic transglycosylase MltG [Polyangiaceae bacterium]